MTHNQIKQACENVGLTVRQNPATGRKSYEATRQHVRVYWQTSFEGGLLGLPRVCAGTKMDTHARTISELKYLTFA